MYSLSLSHCLTLSYEYLVVLALLYELYPVVGLSLVKEKERRCGREVEGQSKT